MVSPSSLTSVLLHPVFESDRGLPVPWSLIVQGEELVKAFPRVWKVYCCPTRPWCFPTAFRCLLAPASSSSVSGPSLWPGAGFCDFLREGCGSLDLTRSGWAVMGVEPWHQALPPGTFSVSIQWASALSRLRGSYCFACLLASFLVVRRVARFFCVFIFQKISFL